MIIDVSCSFFSRFSRFWWPDSDRRIMIPAIPRRCLGTDAAETKARLDGVPDKFEISLWLEIEYPLSEQILPTLASHWRSHRVWLSWKYPECKSRLTIRCGPSTGDLPGAHPFDPQNMEVLHGLQRDLLSSRLALFRCTPSGCTQILGAQISSPRFVVVPSP